MFLWTLEGSPEKIVGDPELLGDDGPLFISKTEPLTMGLCLCGQPAWAAGGTHWSTL